jgi:alkanesulfonate monooxygenase SsuD/methylene tetrahydromethanopterin reductase-like flavin-dependent oxidoreductase (luciferase family)
MIIDIQLNPAVEPWERIREGVLVAEAAGFRTAYVFDHFAGDLLGGGEQMLECFSLLGAMASATTTIGLGALVVNVANRNPGAMAMAAASVQTISGGRLVLGLGAGAAPNTQWSAEHRTLGIELSPTIAARHRRLFDTLDLIDELWADDRAAAHQSFHRPRPRPPIFLGVNSEPLARMAAARTDGLNVRSSHPDLAAIIAAAADERARVRPEGSADDMIVSVWAHFDRALADPDDPRRRQWADMGVNRLVVVCLTPHDAAELEHFFA